MYPSETPWTVARSRSTVGEGVVDDGVGPADAQRTQSANARILALGIVREGWVRVKGNEGILSALYTLQCRDSSAAQVWRAAGRTMD